MKLGVLWFSLPFFFVLSGNAAAEQKACTHADVSNIGTIEMTTVLTRFPLSASFVNRLDSIWGVNGVERLGKLGMQIYWNTAFDWDTEIWPKVLAACEDEYRK